MERKLKRFNILLDDESLLYFPGSFLTGKVLLELEESTPALGLYFHIIGEGVVRLSSKRSEKTLATDRENYIDFRMRLLGDAPGEQQPSSCSSLSSSMEQQDNDDDDDEVDLSSSGAGRQKILVLSPGVHTFPFKLGLPAQLPSTFLGQHGWVQYFCRAVLKEPSGVVHKNQQVFIIINPIDLNEEPLELQQPAYCEAEQKVAASGPARLLPGSSAGPISCKVRLDRRAFVPGECMLVSASIENQSRRSVKRTRAVLAETVEYRAKNKLIQAETRELCAVERAKIAPRCTDVWKKVQLQIPALPPTNLRGCQLISISYELRFQIITGKVAGGGGGGGGSAKSLPRGSLMELKLPIVMATYPLRNSDGTLKRRKGAAYPSALPIFRPWLEPARSK